MKNKKAPITDYMGSEIFEGNRILREDGILGRVVYKDKEWIMRCDNGKKLPLHEQVGEKHKALVV